MLQQTQQWTKENWNVYPHSLYWGNPPSWMGPPIKINFYSSLGKLDIRSLDAKAVEVPPLESLSQMELKNIINRMTEFRWFLNMTQREIEDYWKKQDPYVGTTLGE